MAMGNRRVDYPKELLVHLDNGVLPYVIALGNHTNRAEVQPHHFLLGPDNSEREAADLALQHIFDTTAEVLRQWNDDRVWALTLLGRAQHTIQDSFSPAHTVRKTDSPLYGVTAEEASAMEVFVDAAVADAGDAPTDAMTQLAPCRGKCACIRRVKAYMPRAKGHRKGTLYHGTSDGTIGHITSEDSIYRKGRDCHRPDSRSEVWECLDQHARQAVVGTAAYMHMVREQIRSRNLGSGFDEQTLQSGFDALLQEHFPFCEDP
jgi:hypothetical protein